MHQAGRGLKPAGILACCCISVPTMSESVTQVNEKQVFVRNLPFDVTQEEFAAIFEEIGPLKNASIASANGVGKGFGFVKFALEADAHTAIEKLQGFKLRGRKLILELGLKKERKPKDKTLTNEMDADAAVVAPETKAQKPEKVPQAVPAVPKAGTEAASSEPTVKRSRQVLVFGVSMDVNKKHFRAIGTKGHRKTEVELLKEEHELSSELHIITPPGKIMLLTAHTHKDAAEHLQALDGATMHSLIVAYQTRHAQELKKLGKAAEGHSSQLEGLDLTKPRKEKLFARTVAQITPSDQRKRKCRLIVRNLSFLATEQNLLDKMAKFGPVVSVELPKKPASERPEGNQSGDNKKHNKHGKENNKTPTERSMGFGFVTFLCESDAQRAVSTSAGLRVCNREVAVDFCMSKETYEKYGKKQEEGVEAQDGETGDTAQENERENESKAEDSEGEEVGSEGSGSDSDSDSSDGDASAAEEDSEGEDEDQEEGSDVEDDGSDAAEGEEDEAVSDEDDGSQDDAGSEEGSADGSDVEEDDASAGQKEKKTPTEDVHEGCTVFVRGLAFDATAADLKRALGKFGRIALAIVVKDKVTDISKGSAFVKFHQPEWAAACVAEAALQGGIMIKDRQCKVDLAVDRQSAQSIKDSEMAKRGKDKRNLYLANEGLILPGAEDAAGHSGAAHKSLAMSEADKEKRMRAQTEKRKKLQNPLFFVSPTRLSIRNLSKSVTDKELRELCLSAAKAGIKNGLVKRTDMEAFRLAQGSDYITQQLQQQGAFKPGMDLDTVPPAVGKHCLKNSKVMLDMQRIRGGAPQSRGYAFAEFIHHAHALACLRELNNNAQYSSHHSAGGAPGVGEAVGGKLIVEFSLENIQKVKILREREARQQKRKEEAAASGDAVPSKKDKKDKKDKKKEVPAPTATVPPTAITSNTTVQTKGKPTAATAAAPAGKAQLSTASEGDGKGVTVNAGALTTTIPEGVNPKHYLKQLERERLKRKRSGDKEGAATTPPAAAAAPTAAAAPATAKAAAKHDDVAPASKKAKVSAPVPAKSSGPAPAKAAAPAPSATLPAATTGKRKQPSDDEPASDKGKGSGPADQPAPKKAKEVKERSAVRAAHNTQKARWDKPDTNKSKPAPAAKQGEVTAVKSDKASKAGKGGSGKDSGAAAAGAEASPKPKGVWGGHKRLRAAKKAGQSGGK